MGLLTGCKNAKVTGEHEFAAAPAGEPRVIYVADFEVGVQRLEHEEGVLSGEAADPAARARQLVDLMADRLVQDLTKAGFTATRLAPGQPLPSAGWLVRGVFTEVQEGNRLQRAMIGFGHGQTDLQVVTCVDSLSQGPPKPMYEVDTKVSSGKGPGAATTLIFGLYGAAARFVSAGHGVEKNVKQTATQIARHVAKRVKRAG